MRSLTQFLTFSEGPEQSPRLCTHLPAWGCFLGCSRRLLNSAHFSVEIIWNHLKSIPPQHQTAGPHWTCDRMRHQHVTLEAHSTDSPVPQPSCGTGRGKPVEMDAA